MPPMLQPCPANSNFNTQTTSQAEVLQVLQGMNSDIERCAFAAAIDQSCTQCAYTVYRMNGVVELE